MLRDAMPDGGELRITTLLEHVERPTAELAAGDYIRITVSDTGAGVPNEARKRIFDPFYTTKGTGGGTGLGLSAAKAVIERHGGHIDLESSCVGEGSTFTILLPACEAPPPSVGVAGREEEPLGHGELVLVVEDDPLVQRSAVRLMKQAGYRVIAAHDAASARDLVLQRGRDIGLVLCDVILPDGRGPALLDELMPQLPNARVVLASGYMDQRIERNTLHARGWRFLGKPYSSSDLLRTARELLD